jgi:DNA-binding response OmpR family regulator
VAAANDRGSGLKILCIDNDATIRMVTKITMEKRWPCKVIQAINGSEGVRVALKESPQLILLDMIMPGLDGMQTLKKLRESGCKAPVIFITAKNDVSELQKTEGMQVAGVIQKPFTPDILVEHCKPILGA